MTDDLLSVTWSNATDWLIAGVVAMTVVSGDFAVGSFAVQELGAVRVWGTVFLLLAAVWKGRPDRATLTESGWVLAPLVAFFGYLALRASVDGSAPAARTYLVDSAIVILDAFLIWWLLAGRSMVLRLCWCIVAGGGLLFLLGLLQIGYTNNPMSGWSPVGTKVGLYRVWGLSAVAGLVLMGFGQRSRLQWAAWAIGISALVYAILATQSRIAVVAVVVTAAWIAVGLAVRRRYVPLLLVVGGLVLVLGIFAGIGGRDVLSRFHQESYRLAPGQQAPQRALTQPSAQAPGGAPQAGAQAPVRRGYARGFKYLDLRILMAEEALRLFLRNPVWGNGPAGYAVVDPDIEASGFVYTYPHNVLLEALTVGGAVGGGLLVLAVLLPLVPVFRGIAEDERALALSAYLPFALLASLVSGDFYDFRLYWYVALLVPVVAQGMMRRKG